MLDRVKFLFMLAVSFFYFNIFYEINYYLVKSFFYFMRSRI